MIYCFIEPFINYFAALLYSSLYGRQLVLVSVFLYSASSTLRHEHL